MTTETLPSLRVREADGSPNVIPVYEMSFSGATVTRISPVGVQILMDSGGGSSSSTVYSATANQYVVLATATDLTAERVLTASTGLTLTDGGANNNVLLNVNTNVRDKVLGFYAPGNLTTAMLINNERVFIPFNMDVLRVHVSATTGPTGTAAIVQLNQYNNVLGAGTGMFTNANRPQIAAGALVGSSLTFAIPTLYANSYVGVNMDQVGSTVAGSNLTITVVVRTS